jgi:hypothetical protein
MARKKSRKAKAKTMPSKKPGLKKAKARRQASARLRPASSKGMRAQALAAGFVQSRCFPTEIPNVFIKCDYNPRNGRYDRNCRQVGPEECL